MHDLRYRTCVWCYSTLGGRRSGRFCCTDCQAAAETSLTCEYCGEPAQARDHVVPRAFRYSMDGTRELQILLARMPDTVPSCHECNSIAGSDVFQSLDEKRQHIQKRLSEKYQRLLCYPAWDDDEIADMGPRMRQWLAGSEAARRITQIRISWPGNA